MYDTHGGDEIPKTKNGVEHSNHRHLRERGSRRDREGGRGREREIFLNLAFCYLFQESGNGERKI